MSSFKDFLRFYNNKVVVPTLETIQKKIAFYHDKDIDLLKLGFTLPNFANICLQISTFTEGDKDVLENFREDVVGGPFIINTCKAVVDKTFFSKVHKQKKMYCWDWLPAK